MNFSIKSNSNDLKNWPILCNNEDYDSLHLNWSNKLHVISIRFWKTKTTIMILPSIANNRPKYKPIVLPFLCQVLHKHRLGIYLEEHCKIKQRQKNEFGLSDYLKMPVMDHDHASNNCHIFVLPFIWTLYLLYSFIFWWTCYEMTYQLFAYKILKNKYSRKIYIETEIIAFKVHNCYKFLLLSHFIMPPKRVY